MMYYGCIIFMYIAFKANIQVQLNKLEYGEKVKKCICKLFQKVKLSYILDSLYVKLTANESQKSVYQNIRIFTFEFQ